MLFTPALPAAPPHALQNRMRIGIAGIAGRMGSSVASLLGTSGATLAGGTLLAGERPPEGVAIYAHIEALAGASDAVIDFTHPAAVPDHAAALARHGTAWVLGTTGLSPAEQHDVHRAADLIAVVQAANFSAGITLLLAAARQLARALPAATHDAEIVEIHHRQKIDAPSGTALALAQAVAAGRGAEPEITDANRTGQRGTGIGIASLRAGQIAGEHRLSFTSAEEQIELAHRAFDRRIFAQGAIRAAIWTQNRAPGLYAMADVLGISDA